MQNIKNIIFDLGGVFMNIDFAKTNEAFAAAGLTNFKEHFTQHHATPMFELLETGKITPEEFYESFRKEVYEFITNEQIRDAWNALLVDFPKERIVWLDEIRTKYNVYLYSNTNKIHYDSFIISFTEQTGFPDFNHYFKKAYYSHELGLRKPYPESFTHILNEQNLLAEETVFIDDTFSNIEGAQKAGLQTIHLVHPTTVLDLGL